MRGTGAVSVGHHPQVPSVQHSDTRQHAQLGPDCVRAASHQQDQRACSQQQHGTIILTVLSVALNLDDWSLGMASDKISISVIVACRIGDDDESDGAMISLRALQDSELQLKDIACEYRRRWRPPLGSAPCST